MRGHEFDPWSKKISYAEEQLKVPTPQLLSHTLEFTGCNYRTHVPKLLSSCAETTDARVP